MEKEKKKIDNKQNWIMPVTAILIAVIIGGSIFATQYYKQKSEEKQQQIKLDTENKAKADEADLERRQKNGLQHCLNKADSDYWAYMKLNGTTKADGSVLADQRFWDSAEKTKQDTIDNCNEQYRNKSFNGLDTLF
ncbi:MAG: hypothetical protein WCG99_04075 [Candidatus Berkelbacteria bacterium]